ncbi:unnamed protein product [Arabidopsis thaliana]|uniref:Uncharacterized protein n=1 Tax=Arabidopsis thaliana TaxID=3702 RepID=A0A654G185_ARATH|nr:unnamed protein product [Arabidopsis thaliana]VYS66902.1 unnamed protein product [Arabidopsis thaliana]
MTLPPGLYSGTSSLALVARASAFGLGLVYGNMKLKVLKCSRAIDVNCRMLLYSFC